VTPISVEPKAGLTGVTNLAAEEIPKGRPNLKTRYRQLSREWLAIGGVKS